MSSWLIAVLALVLAFVCAPTQSASARSTSKPACSSYPRPGTLAPLNTAIPAAIGGEYRIFRGQQRRQPVTDLDQLQRALPAAGIVRSGVRYLGRSADHGKLYAIAARHFLPYRIAPLRCLAAVQRPVERYLHAALLADYKHRAVCVVEVGGDSIVATRLQTCGPLSGSPDALLGTGSTPLLGLAPDGVSVVTASYLTSPPQTLKVHHNFYQLVDPSLSSVPCGVQWFNPSGNVAKSLEGCDYLPTELPALSTYRTDVAAQLRTVQSDLGVLSLAISSGNVAAAQADWLTAHLAWLALGQDDGAYGCFGALGGKIDGTSAGLVDGAESPKFTGFHKVEMDLWTAGDLPGAAADTATLEQLVNKLVAIPLTSELPASATGVSNWVLRPHEILEDAIRDTLSGSDDYGSGTGLASVTADVAAVRELLTLLEPTLGPLAPHLIARASAELDLVTSAADDTRVNGAWVGVSVLPAAEREKVNAAIGAAVETLAPVPDLLTSTGKAAPPT